MEANKLILLKSIIKFLNGELQSSALDEDSKEALEVSIQCLGNAFSLDQNREYNEIDLLALVDQASRTVSEEKKRKAEEYKTLGNDLMKNQDFANAAVEYTLAIEMNPYNAVYYCNRAAAYTKLQLDADAVKDCNEAIKLDPNYSKAYGRLGIAYSNLNKYELACEAYKTALKLDPTNVSYDTNLKLAEERLKGPNAAPGFPDLTSVLQNPNVINMASQVLNDSNFCNILSGILNSGSTNADSMPDAVESIVQAGHTLAQRVVSEDPAFYNTFLSRRFQDIAQGQGQQQQQQQGQSTTNDQGTQNKNSTKDANPKDKTNN